METIVDFLASIPGLKQDFKLDWKDVVKADWKIDWDAKAGEDSPVPESVT